MAMIAHPHLRLDARGVAWIDSVDAREATIVELPWSKLSRIRERITAIPGVNRRVYDLTPKPPATIEYV